MELSRSIGRTLGNARRAPLELLGTLTEPTPLALPPARGVDVPVTARRQVAAERAHQPGEHLDLRVMVGARGHAVVLVESEVGALLARDQVMDVEDAAAVPAEETGDTTAASVARENALADELPLG